MHRKIEQKKIEQQLTLSFFNEASFEDEESLNGFVISADDDESDPPSVEFSQESTEAINSSNSQLQTKEKKNQPRQRVKDMFQTLRKQKYQRQDESPSGSVVQYPSKSIKNKKELQAAKKPQSNKEFIRILSHHIQSILRREQRLKLEVLVDKVRLRMPEKLRSKVSSTTVTEVLRMARNPLNHFTKTKICKTGYIKSELNVGEYCKNLLDLLDTSKVVYFISVEKLVETKNSKVTDHKISNNKPTIEQSLTSSRNTMLFRGVLGSNLQSFCDILQTSDDNLARNKSFTFLLKVLSLKSGPAQGYLFMSKAFMDQYGQSLRFASEVGFIFAQLASSLKDFNPIYYWLRDLKLLARKYSVKTPQELKQILQYEATRFDKDIYAEYFRNIHRKMRKAISTLSSSNRRQNFQSFTPLYDDDLSYRV